MAKKIQASENKNQIKKAIKESYRDYQEGSIGMDENECWAHEHGWKEGYEWVLTELAVNNKISAEVLKKYMGYLYEH